MLAKVLQVKTKKKEFVIIYEGLSSDNYQKKSIVQNLRPFKESYMEAFWVFIFLLVMYNCLKLLLFKKERFFLIKLYKTIKQINIGASLL